MGTTIFFFPVDNGDMTLIQLESGRTILLDTHIRQANDDPDDEAPDVGKELRKRLKKDANGRHYVDVFCLSHPDEDHCGGIKDHFYFGNPDEYPKQSDKILINEIWSSPIIFRRASSDHTLCDDAKAFNAEAKRRVQRFRDLGSGVMNGDRILILGEDVDGKTDDIEAIVVKIDGVIDRVNGSLEQWMKARLIAPLSHADDDAEEQTLSKNQSSVGIQFSFVAGTNPKAAQFLVAGDADVAIWERQWKRLQKDHKEWLEYDLLLCPHHCSWHTLSYDSWSEKGEKAQINSDAREALSQAHSGATIVASSKPISDNDSDPPCVRAKREYLAIVTEVAGKFWCVGEYPSINNAKGMEFEVTSSGIRLKRGPSTPAGGGGGAVGGQPLVHGSRSR